MSCSIYIFEAPRISTNEYKIGVTVQREWKFVRYWNTYYRSIKILYFSSIPNDRKSWAMLELQKKLDIFSTDSKTNGNWYSGNIERIQKIVQSIVNSAHESDSSSEEDQEDDQDDEIIESDGEEYVPNEENDEESDESSDEESEESDEERMTSDQEPSDQELSDQELSDQELSDEEQEEKKERDYFDKIRRFLIDQEKEEKEEENEVSNESHETNIDLSNDQEHQFDTYKPFEKKREFDGQDNGRATKRRRMV
ncbi:MAG: hypothetical protein Dasosvirus4_7 [Dasosvirus sp.]|uniref:Uncharacterized protein n=1 Tax=Dasosvirus sp. TaxID=2487764 RepID=A0A3G4ZRF1_9VIRU|nr:MAG: hypothetical protein Dasosvirus4_7 [Dasosvirus sp.]